MADNEKGPDIHGIRGVQVLQAIRTEELQMLGMGRATRIPAASVAGASLPAAAAAATADPR